MVLIILVGCAILAVIGLAVKGGGGGSRRPLQQFTEKKNLSSEYRNYMKSDAWQGRRHACLLWTFGRDVLLPWLRATDVDHLHYRNLGHELPFFDVVPLNRSTHIFVTRAREAVGRGPVNFVLKAAFLVWLLPYAIIILLIANWKFPQIGYMAHHYVHILFSKVT